MIGSTSLTSMMSLFSIPAIGNIPFIYANSKMFVRTIFFFLPTSCALMYNGMLIHDEEGLLVSNTCILGEVTTRMYFTVFMFL
jgi:hypothetical protein